MNANTQDYKRLISEDRGILYTGLHKQVIPSLTIIHFFETDVNLFICHAIKLFPGILKLCYYCMERTFWTQTAHFNWLIIRMCGIKNRLKAT